MKCIAATAAAVASLAGAAFLAVNHPLAPLAALAAALAVSALAWRFPNFGEWALPATLPWLALAPYSGAVACEEVDILVLALAAGGYARRAGWGAPARAAHVHDSARNVALLIMPMLFVSWFVALVRGLAGAEAVGLDWFQGYMEPANALRIGKSMLLAIWLVPLWHARSSAPGTVHGIWFAVGMSAGLLVTGALVVAERVAFTGLTNFSTDYRVTGPFWEMHTGGAALDGYLVLALPWVAWLALRARQPWQWLAVVAVAGLAYYVTLVTFSRAVYLAVPIGLAAFLLVHARQSQRLPGTLLRQSTVLAVAGLLAAVGAWFAFRHGGYRTLAAVLGLGAMSLALAPALRNRTGGATLVAALGGVLPAIPATAAALVVPKGPYLLFAVAFAVSAIIALRANTATPTSRWVGPSLAFLAVAAALVAWHWGGAPALRDTAWVLAAWLALMVAHVVTPQGLVPASLQLRALVLAVGVTVAGVIAVMTGGDYMSGRLAGARDDLDARQRHWSDTIALLETPADWALGQGYGRFPVRYFFAVPDGPHPGSYRVTGNEGRAWLVLAGPRHSASFGEVLRVGQWLTVVPGPYRVSLAVRAEKEVQLHVEFCDRHLLYNGECAIAKHEVKPGATWQRIELVLDTGRIPARRWLVPNRGFFALAVESERGRVDIAEVAVAGADGVDRIANGIFEDGIARWFTISERHHLPWHAKNLALNVLFEQGLVGLMLFCALVLGALWRVSFGHARRHPLAPALAASITGFLVVGVFDSLLDVPRVALLFWLLTFVAVTLPAARPPPRGGAAIPPA